MTGPWGIQGPRVSIQGRCISIWRAWNCILHHINIAMCEPWCWNMNPNICPCPKSPSHVGFYIPAPWVAYGIYIHNISIYYPGKTRCSMIFWNQKSGLHLLGIFWGRKHHGVRRSMSQPIWPAIFSFYSHDVPFPLPRYSNIYIYIISLYTHWN